MWNNILSQSSYGRYNKFLAKIAGLHAAVYWSCICEIGTRVVKKKTYDSQGYFKLDRKYVEEQTALDLAAQRECDNILEKLGIIEVSKEDENVIGINSEKAVAIITLDDPAEIKKISQAAKVSRTEKAKTKKEAIVAMLKNSIVETDTELLEAYRRWVETAYEKGICTKAGVKTFKDTLEKYTTDKAAKLEILRLCILYQYRDVAWGIKIYESQNMSGTRLTKPQKQATDVMDFKM